MSNHNTHWPTVIDLFAGCGGVTEALKKRHFRVLAAVDNDPVACRTFRRNHPRVRLYESDIRKVASEAMRIELSLTCNIDLLVVCAPCQPFSSQGRKDANDARASLIFSAVGFAAALEPTLILFENVPGLASPRFSGLLERLRRDLQALNYRLSDPEMIDAADYGVPQRRQRCILLAKKGHAPPAVPGPVTPSGRRRTVKQAIGGLKRLASGECDPSDPLHFARSHQPIAIQRLEHIPANGGSRFSLPAHLVLPCHEDHTGHPDVYGRMRWDDVAPTLTTGCTDITRGRFAHPTDNRAITLREAARLQTFRDDYKFEGNSRQIATQIGNAVPVKLIEQLCPVLRQGLWS